MWRTTFCHCKALKWQFSDKFGEDKFVVTLGGLHIEKAILNVLGDLLDGSVFSEAFFQSVFSENTGYPFFLSNAMSQRRK